MNLQRIFFVFITLTLPTVSYADPMAEVRDPEVIRLHNSVSQVESRRKLTRTLYQRLQATLRAGQPLSEDELTALNWAAYEHSRHAKELRRFVNIGRAHSTLHVPVQIHDLVKWATELAASLTFTDSIRQVVKDFQQSPELRELVNRPSPTYGRSSDLLYQAMLDYYNVKNFDRQVNLIDLYERYRQREDLAVSPELRYLSSVIEASAYYKYYLSQTPAQRTSTRSKLQRMNLWLRVAHLSDRWEDFWSHEVIGAGSEAFGNAVGAIQWRRGLLHGNLRIARRMKEILQPGDILLEATPFRATSLLIPGHYGHVAMWVGTEGELKELGLWDHPWIRKYQHRIASGRSIVEALRTGVTLNSVEHFLDIDDLLILRPGSRISLEERKRAILRGMSHLGQKYDFNFDTTTDDTIVCSELAFKTYTKVAFRQERAFSRWTVNPDAIAEQGLPGGAFFPVMMILEGQIVSENLRGALAVTLKRASVQ